MLVITTTAQMKLLKMRVFFSLSFHHRYGDTYKPLQEEGVSQCFVYSNHKISLRLQFFFFVAYSAFYIKLLETLHAPLLR